MAGSNAGRTADRLGAMSNEVDDELGSQHREGRARPGRQSPENQQDRREEPATSPDLGQIDRDRHHQSQQPSERNRVLGWTVDSQVPATLDVADSGWIEDQDRENRMELVEHVESGSKLEDSQGGNDGRSAGQEPQDEKHGLAAANRRCGQVIDEHETEEEGERLHHETSVRLHATRVRQLGGEDATDEQQDRPVERGRAQRHAGVDEKGRQPDQHDECNGHPVELQIERQAAREVITANRHEEDDHHDQPDKAVPAQQ